MKKKAVELSFAWIFSIVVGAVILFIAIYFASQLIETSSYETNTKTTKKLIGIFDSLQTTAEESKTEKVTFAIDTKIYPSCNNEGDFGESIIQISEKFGFKNKWSKPGGDISAQDVYLFSEDIIEVNAHEDVYFFTKQFEMPFKTADMVMMYSKPYCFVNAPREIRNDIENLGQNVNLFAVTDIDSCSGESVSVCFDSNNCDVNVNTVAHTIEKNKETVYFIDETIYAAIFSSKGSYECGIKRIMMKLSQLSELYGRKAQFITQRGCNTGLYGDMVLLQGRAKEFKDMRELEYIKTTAELIKNKNGELGCYLF